MVYRLFKLTVEELTQCCGGIPNRYYFTYEDWANAEKYADEAAQTGTWQDILRTLNYTRSNWEHKWTLQLVYASFFYT